MTRQEFYEKYGDVKVKFCHYYKYTFTYSATLPDGNKLACMVGGDSADIYRHEVGVYNECTVISLQPYEGHIYSGVAEVESFGFYDY